MSREATATSGSAGPRAASEAAPRTTPGEDARGAAHSGPTSQPSSKARSAPSSQPPSKARTTPTGGNRSGNSRSAATGRPAGKGRTAPKDATREAGSGVRAASARTRAAARARRDAARRAVRPRLVPARRQSIPVAAVIAAAWALGVGLLVCVVVAVIGWTVGGHGDATFGSALHSGALAFVAAHMAPVSLPSATFSLLPLGLLALPALLTYRAGRWAARAADCQTLGDVGLLTGTAAGTYAVLALIVSTLGVVGPAQVTAATALVAAGLVSSAGIGLGALSSSQLWPAVLQHVPTPVRHGMRAAGVVLATLGVAAGATVALALAMHFSSVVALTEQIAPGAAASGVLSLLCLVYLPTMFVWALAYLAGTGVLLGGAMITPFGGAGGLAPAFPLLAAVPDQPSPLAPMLLLLPVLAGVLGGLVVLRSSRRGDGRLPVIETLTAAGMTGLATAVIGLLGSGSLGDGRLAHVGPTAWAMGLAVTGLVLLGLAPTALLGTLLAGTATHRPASPQLQAAAKVARPRRPVPASADVDLRVRPVPDPGIPEPVTGAARADRGAPAFSAAASSSVDQVTGVVPVPVTGSTPSHEDVAVGEADAARGVLAGATSALGRTWGRIRPLLHSDGN